MKALWVCNLILPGFCQEFQVKKTVFGGWMTGLLQALTQCQECEIDLAFPIRDSNRKHDGQAQGVRYYAFAAAADNQAQDNTACQEMVQDFLRILADSQPDIIHLWGTEYPHAWAMLQACLQTGLSGRVICHIQGLLTFYKHHYALGLPEALLTEPDGQGRSLADDIQAFARQSLREADIVKRSGFVLGRTFWDENCVRQLAPQAHYRFCEELLREPFYQARVWSARKCRKHSIFISQAAYPIKGFHFVVQALAILLRDYPDLQVYVGGHDPMQPDKEGKRSPYGKYLLESCSRLNVLEHVHFLGMLSAEQIVPAYLAAHVFVSASTIENSSNSVAEAMLLGVPVVASFVGGMPTLIQHGVNGLLYQADAPYMLAACVRQIFKDESLAKTISQQARIDMRERHAPEKVVQQVMSVYREACGEEQR